MSYKLFDFIRPFMSIRYLSNQRRHDMLFKQQWRQMYSSRNGASSVCFGIEVGEVKRKNS